MKKDRETAPQKYDTRHRADRFSIGRGGWGEKGLKCWNTQSHSSAPKVTKGHQSRTSASSSRPVLGLCSVNSSGGSAEGTRLPLACASRILLDVIHFPQWWKLTDMDEWGWVEHPHQFATECRRTNKIKSIVELWLPRHHIHTESAFIDFPPIFEPRWGRNWSVVDTCVISTSVPTYYCIFILQSEGVWWG